jgi:hypothetical protein
VLDQVTKCGCTLTFAKEFCSDKKIVLAAVKSGCHLRNASKLLQSDRDVVLAAVGRDGNSLGHAARLLQSDKEIVLAAVKQYGCALEYAGPDLQNDKIVVMAAVTQSGWALRYASSELRNDKDIAIAAVMQSAPALQHVHPQLLHTDRDVIKAAIRHDAMSLYKSALQRASQVPPILTQVLLCDEIILLAVASCPAVLGLDNNHLRQLRTKLRTKQAIFAGISASVDALQYVQLGSTKTLEVDLAQHFVECCKQQGLKREACAAKAAACQSKSLCIRIISACYLTCLC